MNDKERKIQEAAEKGIEDLENAGDIKMYQLLYKGIKQQSADPTQVFSADFAAKITSRITEKAAAKAYRQEYWIKTLGLLGILVLSIISLLSFDLYDRLSANFKGLQWYLLLGIVLFLAIEFLDKKFVRKTIV